jgi:hypothetical protein
MLSEKKQEAKMNWVKCTDMRKQPIYVNTENATSILWNEIERSSIIAFANIGGDTIEVIEEPEAIIRGAMTCPEALKARSVPPTPCALR